MKFTTLVLAQAAATQSTASPTPAPWLIQYLNSPITLLIVGAFLGGLIKYMFDCRLPGQQVKRAALRCSATYCQNLLSPTVNDVKDNLEILLDGRRLSNPVVINYRIENTGNIAASDVNMRVETAKADHIIRSNFYVDETVQCNRLISIEDSDKLLHFRWTYINPKDAITLVLLVAPCEDAKCITLEIDAKDVVVTQEGMREDCSVIM